jgi:molybdopterin-guanine dinucleotide biosynthesis protein A
VQDHSLHALLAQLSVVAIDMETVRRQDPDGLSAFNMNTPDDWRQALRLDENID